MSLPETTKALVLTSPQASSITTVPTPLPNPGAATLRVLHSLLHPNTINIIRSNPTNNAAHSKLPYPLVFGGYGVARIAALPPDATRLHVGQLVFIEPYVRARDDQGVFVFCGAFFGVTEESQRFGRENWRDGSWAEYMRLPLENIWPVDEQRVTGSPADGGLGLRTQDLVFMAPLCVAYAGLRKIDVRAGETVLVSPATGVFSGAAVAIALGLGASVIAGGRNPTRLARLAHLYPSIKTFTFKDDSETASTEATSSPETSTSTGAASIHASAITTLPPLDAIIDISPPAASSTHLSTAISSLRRNARVCLMGGRPDPSIPLPYLSAVFNDITIRGSLMFERDDVRTVVRMVESGALKLGKQGGMEVFAEFSLDDYEKGLDVARQCEAGRVAVISP